MLHSELLRVFWKVVLRRYISTPIHQSIIGVLNPPMYTLRVWDTIIQPCAQGVTKGSYWGAMRSS